MPPKASAFRTLSPQSYLAGAFGNHMDVRSAVSVGLLPRELGDNVLLAGKSVGKGARLALRCVHFEKEVERLARRCSYIGLSMRADFNDAYVNALGF